MSITYQILFRLLKQLVVFPVPSVPAGGVRGGHRAGGQDQHSAAQVCSVPHSWSPLLHIDIENLSKYDSEF